MKLFEIKDTYLAFQNAIDQGEIPVEAIADTLESIEGEFEEKADNIACIIKDMSAEAQAIKAEESNLYERRKAKERQVEGLREYLSKTMMEMGKSKVETPRNVISFRRSTGLEIEDEARFTQYLSRYGDEYLNYEEPTINKKAVTEAVKAGVEFAGASLVTRQNLQIR